MATDLTANFTANFSSFTEACAKAEVSLKKIQDGADSVTPRLTRMADSLSGTKIIQQATLMAEAVERVGGVSALTEKELAKLGPTATEAAAKLTALGQEIPPGIQKIADAAKAAQASLDATAKSGVTGMESLLGSVVKIGAALGVSFGVGAIVGGIKNLVTGAVDMASAIDDASKKLGVSAEKFQGWVAAAEQAGATSQDVSTAVAKMNANLDGGSKSTVDALKAAGLEFHAIRDLSPQDAFETIAEAIKKIPDPMTQAKVALELFGKGGQVLLPAIKDDIVKMGEAAPKMSNETVAALDQAGDAWKRFGDRVTIVTGTALAATEHYIDQSTSSWKSFGTFLAEAASGGVAYALTQQDIREALKKTNEQFGFMGPTLEQLNRGTHLSAEELAAQESALKKAAAAAEAHEKAVSDLADVFTGKKLNESLQLMSDALAHIGATVDNFDLPTDQFLSLGKTFDDAIAKGAHLNDTAEELHAQFVLLNSPFVPLIQNFGTFSKSLGDYLFVVKDGAERMAAFTKAMNELSKELDKMQVPLKALLSSSGLPNYVLKLDAAQIATSSLAAAQRGVTPEILKAAQSLLAQGKNIEYVIAQLKWSKEWHDTDAEALKQYDAQTKILNQSLGQLAGAFATLAQIGGGAFSGLLKTVGQGVGSINLIKTGFTELAKAETEWNVVGGHTKDNFVALAASAATAAVSVVGLFASGVNLVKGLIDSANAARLLRDALAVADRAGQDFVLIQADLVGGFKYGGDVATAFSDSLVAAMEKSKQALEGFYELKTGAPALIQSYAEALNLAGIIREIGGVSDQNIGHLEALIGNLFDIIKLGGPTAGQAVKALNDALAEMSGYLSKNGVLWDTTFQAAIAKAKELGLNLSAVNDLMAAQQGNLEKAIGGVTGVVGAQAQKMLDLQKAVKDAQDAYDALVASGADQDQIAAAADKVIKAQEDVKGAAVTTQDEFDRLNRIALNTFNTLIASGKSPVEAMQAIGGSIDDLIKDAQAFGLSGNAAFEELSRWRDLTKNNEGLLTQISSLNDLMVATANLGGLNAQSFSDFEAQGVDAYNKLIAAGFTQQEAEEAEKPLLESIIKLHNDKGIAIDDATKKIIDQAEKDGVLGKQQATTQDVLREGLGAIITLLGGDLPKAWQDFTDAGTTAAGKVTGKGGLSDVEKNAEAVKKQLEDKQQWQTWADNAQTASGDITRYINGIPTTVDVSVNYNSGPGPQGPDQLGRSPGDPNYGQGSDATPGPGFALGGMVMPKYLAGGHAIVAPWIPQGTDTVPAMLTPGERVLSVSDTRRFDSGGFARPSSIINIDARGALFPDRQSIRDFAALILKQLPNAATNFVTR